MIKTLRITNDASAQEDRSQRVKVTGALAYSNAIILVIFAYKISEEIQGVLDIRLLNKVQENTFTDFILAEKFILVIHLKSDYCY